MIWGHLSLQGLAATPRRSSDLAAHPAAPCPSLYQDAMIAGPRIDLTVWACRSCPVSSVAMFVRQYTKTLRRFVSAIPDLNGTGKVGPSAPTHPYHLSGIKLSVESS